MAQSDRVDNGQAETASLPGSRTPESAGGVRAIVLVHTRALIENNE